MAASQGGYKASLGWSVGLPSWLDSKDSKVNRYWRVQEYGSNATDWPWQGQRVVGLWGPNAGPRGRLIAGDLSMFQGSRNDQKFVPFFRTRGADLEGAARAALYFFFKGGTGPNMDLIKGRPRGKESAEAAQKRFYFWLMMLGKPGGPRLEQVPFVQGVILREVQAGYYYAKAVESFNPLQEELKALREQTALFRGTSRGKAVSFDPKSAAGLRNARQIVAGDAYDASGREVAPKTGRRRTEKQKHSNNVRGRGFLYTVNASAYAQDNIRDSLGRLTQYQGEIAQVNRTVAIAFQNEVVRHQQQERRRPISGDLIRATRDPRNRTPM